MNKSLVVLKMIRESLNIKLEDVMKITGVSATIEKIGSTHVSRMLGTSQVELVGRFNESYIVLGIDTGGQLIGRMFFGDVYCDTEDEGRSSVSTQGSVEFNSDGVIKIIGLAPYSLSEVLAEESVILVDAINKAYAMKTQLNNSNSDGTDKSLEKFPTKINELFFR